MKTNKKHNIYFLLLLGVSILIASCHKRIELDSDYSNFRRVIGPDGGTINFYEYNPIDSIEDLLLSMQFDANAVDSFVVFNMYEFDDDDLKIELSLLNLTYYTKFLYFIPFSEASEYQNPWRLLHDSIDFLSPVTVRHNVTRFGVPDSAELYRIYIPRKNEWSDNLWVQWDEFGYPTGYNGTQLSFLINGRWTFDSYLGGTEASLVNWEKLERDIDYTYILPDSIIQFEIDNTDYLYVMANE
jgi:hypothetical protein